MSKKKKMPEHYWNHRLVKYPNGSFGMHEAHYTRGKGDAHSITLDAVGVYGDTLEEVKETLERMLKALDKKPLRYRKFVKKKDDKHRW